MRQLFLAQLLVCCLFLLSGCTQQPDQVAAPTIAKTENNASLEAMNNVMDRLANANFMERDGVTPVSSLTSPDSPDATKQAFKLLPHAAVQCRVTYGEDKNFIAYKEEGHPASKEFLDRFMAECQPLLPGLTVDLLQQATSEAMALIENDRSRKSLFNTGLSKAFSVGSMEANVELNEQFEADDFGEPHATATITWKWRP